MTRAVCIVIAGALLPCCFCCLWYNNPCRGTGGERKGNRAAIRSGIAISCLEPEEFTKRAFASDGKLSAAWLERLEVEWESCHPSRSLACAPCITDQALYLAGAHDRHLC